MFFSNQKQDVSQISKNLCLKKLQKQIGQGLRKMSLEYMLSASMKHKQQLDIWTISGHLLNFQC